MAECAARNRRSAGTRRCDRRSGCACATKAARGRRGAVAAAGRDGCRVVTARVRRPFGWPRVNVGLGRARTSGGRGVLPHAGAQPRLRTWARRAGPSWPRADLDGMDVPAARPSARGVQRPAAEARRAVKSNCASRGRARTRPLYACGRRRSRWKRGMTCACVPRAADSAPVATPALAPALGASAGRSSITSAPQHGQCRSPSARRRPWSKCPRRPAAPSRAPQPGCAYAPPAGVPYFPAQHLMRRPLHVRRRGQSARRQHFS